ncbi:unnamed protein product, partial [Polarella glacialis]
MLSSLSLSLLRGDKPKQGKASSTPEPGPVPVKASAAFAAQSSSASPSSSSSAPAPYSAPAARGKARADPDSSDQYSQFLETISKATPTASSGAATGGCGAAPTKGMPSGEDAESEAKPAALGSLLAYSDSESEEEAPKPLSAAAAAVAERAGSNAEKSRQTVFEAPASADALPNAAAAAA